VARPRLGLAPPRLGLAPPRLGLAPPRLGLARQPVVLLAPLCLPRLVTRRGVHQEPATQARRCGLHSEQHRRVGTAFGRLSLTPRCKPFRRNHPRFMPRGRGTGMGTWPMPVKQCREGCVRIPASGREGGRTWAVTRERGGPTRREILAGRVCLCCLASTARSSITTHETHF
jgi:hypothetical protein